MNDLKQRAMMIHGKLFDRFGLPEWRNPLSPLDELVSTILSQNTNDRNRDAAFQNLKACFPTWEAVRDADPEKVVNAIRTAGLSNQKGARIQAVLKTITEQQGVLSLEFLRKMTPETVYDWLINLKGIGPKTAAIVMQFSLDMPAFPVDTHIYRVSGRLGLRPENMTVEEAHPHLASLFPPNEYGPAHLNLIRLGREYCHARRPDCENCPLKELCHFGLQNLKKS